MGQLETRTDFEQAMSDNDKELLAALERYRDQLIRLAVLSAKADVFLEDFHK